MTKKEAMKQIDSLLDKRLEIMKGTDTTGTKLEDLDKIIAAFTESYKNVLER